MANRMRAHKLATVTEGRSELAAEVRDLANLLESQEPDYLVLYDSWEVLVELAERSERLRSQFLKEQPEQEAWLIEKRPWLDPKLELIGKAKKPAGGPSNSPRSRASRSRRTQKAFAQSSA
jgi:hypothetical protein